MTSPHSPHRSPIGPPRLGARERAWLIAWTTTVVVGAGYATAHRLARGLHDPDSWNLGDCRGDQIPGKIYAHYTYARARDEINAALRRCGYGHLTASVERYACEQLADAAAPAVWGSIFARSSHSDIHRDICDGLDTATLTLAAQLAALLGDNSHGQPRTGKRNEPTAGTLNM